MELEQMQVKPSNKLYLLPVVLLLLAAAGAVFFGIRAFNAAREPKVYLTLPGEAAASLDAGSCGIYYEYTLVPSGKAAGVRFTFTNEATGETVAAFPAVMNSNYTVGGVNGVLIARVELPAAGKYRITADYADSAEPLRFVIGKNVVTGPLINGLAAFFTGLFGFLGALLSFLTVFILRMRSKEKLRQQGYME